VNVEGNHVGDLSHLGEDGRARMVDVGAKTESERSDWHLEEPAGG
jgi:molybdenum cofactor biosynthesis enzyme